MSHGSESLNFFVFQAIFFLQVCPMSEMSFWFDNWFKGRIAITLIWIITSSSSFWAGGILPLSLSLSLALSLCTHINIPSSQQKHTNTFCLSFSLADTRKRLFSLCRHTHFHQSINTYTNTRTLSHSLSLSLSLSLVLKNPVSLPSGIKTVAVAECTIRKKNFATKKFGSTVLLRW